MNMNVSVITQSLPYYESLEWDQIQILISIEYDRSISPSYSREKKLIHFNKMPMIYFKPWWSINVCRILYCFLGFENIFYYERSTCDKQLVGRWT